MSRIIIKVTSVLCVMVMLVCVSLTVSAESFEYGPYSEVLKEAFRKHDLLPELDISFGGYRIVYENRDPNAPFIVAEVVRGGSDAISVHEIDGYYLFGSELAERYGCTPSQYVINLDDNTVLTIEEAMQTDRDRYISYFTESHDEKIRIIGDINHDGKLDVKDATDIQKCLAGVKHYENDFHDMVLGFTTGTWMRYVSDFNRDGKRNIKDVTDLQKHLAGITL